MSIFLQKISEELDIDLFDAKEAWTDVLGALEGEKGISSDKFTSEDFKECEKRTRDVLEYESLIMVSDFFESDLDAKNFLETLVSGDINIPNIVNRKKDFEEDLEEDLDEEEPVLSDDIQEELGLDVGDEDGYVEEHEYEDEEEPGGNKLSTGEALRILQESSGVRTSANTSVNGIPRFLQ